MFSAVFFHFFISTRPVEGISMHSKLDGAASAPPQESDLVKELWNVLLTVPFQVSSVIGWVDDRLRIGTLSRSLKIKMFSIN